MKLFFMTLMLFFVGILAQAPDATAAGLDPSVQAMINPLPPPFPPGGPGGGPVCQPEGSRCTFNGDCCQGVCKNASCRAPLYCGPSGFSCNDDDECCDSTCNKSTRRCR